MDSVAPEEFMKLMDKTTYYHPVRNSVNREPEEGLRILLTRVGERSARIPIKVLQAMMPVGYHRTHSWTSGLGDTKAEAERILNTLPEFANNIGRSEDGYAGGPPRAAFVRVETAFMISLWEELNAENKARAELVAKNKHTSAPTIIEISDDERYTVENA